MPIQVYRKRGGKTCSEVEAGSNKERKKTENSVDNSSTSEEAALWTSNDPYLKQVESDEDIQRIIKARRGLDPKAIFFCLEISRATPPTETFSLKKRAYLGPTSMEAEMAFLMANQGLAGPKTLVLDPFVGTGSILLPCAVFGAKCMGGDIDYFSLKGKKGKTPFSSFDQYSLSHPDLLRLDFSPAGRCLREPLGGMFDAIICDPPYGIRAGAKKSGSSNPEKVKPIPKELLRDHIPQTQQYDTTELMCDLADSAARFLRLGGRLVYLLPVLQTEYMERHLVSHPCLKIVANCEQKLRFPLSRRLVTMVKVTEYDYSKADFYARESRKDFSVPSFENLYDYSLDHFLR